jgi:hypothetical protein
MEVDWYQCKGGVWCELNKLDIKHPYLKGLSGVYIIWYEVDTRNIVKIGTGDIQKGLIDSMNSLAIQAFAKYRLFATWAELPKSKIEFVHGYLHRKLKPTISESAISPKSIEVDLPW